MEVPVPVLIEENERYTMGQGNKEKVRRTHCFFIDDFEVYQESREKFEVTNEKTVKYSIDTESIVQCYGVKKFTENAFRRSMINGEALAFWK